MMNMEAKSSQDQSLPMDVSMSAVEAKSSKNQPLPMDVSMTVKSGTNNIVKFSKSQLKRMKNLKVSVNHRKGKGNPESSEVRKIRKKLSSLFKKDKERANYIFNLFTDILKINNFIETKKDEFGSLDFLIKKQTISQALSYFMSIVKDAEATSMGYPKSSNSLYKEQFEEISKIGSGAYGSVYKARHKFDEMDYAVKKIAIKARKNIKIERSLDEVKTLAKLNHPNIIAYKQAWIEKIDGKADGQFSPLSSESNSSQESSEAMDEPMIILYIQMTLCHMNLRQWMDQRTENSPINIIEEIAVQILAGLEYIHGLNIIHHDINPNNIFISKTAEKMLVQLGDFGLACYQTANSLAHNEEFGTPLYIAPEQADGKCNPKSDMYSFGIILFELYNRMNTANERCRTIDQLKNGRLQLLLTDRNLKKWIVKLIRKNPDLRPSAKEILEDLRIDNHLEIAKLKTKIDQLVEENKMLRMQNRRKDDVISTNNNQLGNYDFYKM